MEKLEMRTTNFANKNYEVLSRLFPNAITETIDENGEVVRAVDADILRQEISCEVIEGKDERYQFSWPNKKNAIVLANESITETLRLVREKSVGRNGEKGEINTENIYIEGDNLEALKLLRETYLGKIKMIYIDPPYNTGNDFVYNDDFVQSKEDYMYGSGQFDAEGNRLVKNTENNGRFHTDWLNMLYPRLKIAKDLLTEDGLIFISIDDNEMENLKKICDEIFGEVNATIPFIWQLPRGINAGLVARAHEYILCYAKNISVAMNFNRIDDSEEYSIERCNKKIDSRHPESIIKFKPGIRYEGPNQILTGIIEGSERITIIGKLVFKDGILAEPVELSAGWTMKNMIQDWMEGKKVYDLKGQEIEEFFFKSNGKLYSKKKMTTLSVKSVLKDMPDTQMARKELEELFGSQDYFSYPKTIEIPKLLSKLSTNDGDIILDFFSGSATTAHAIMKINAENNGNRKYILVQLPEKIGEEMEAYKAGFHNICEIGEERIRRAGEKIKKESNADIDYGFRVFKIDSSNMKDVYYKPVDTQQTFIDMLADNIKAERTPEDLLFQVMLDLGVLLSSKIEEIIIVGKKVFDVADGFLLACFDTNITDDVVRAIANIKPYYAVFRDSSMKSDSVTTNFDQIFANISPDTIRKVL